MLRDEGGSDALKAPKQLRVGVLTPSEPFAPISKDGEGVGMAEAAGVLQPAAAPEHAWEVAAQRRRRPDIFIALVVDSITTIITMFTFRL